MIFPMVVMMVMMNIIMLTLFRNSRNLPDDNRFWSCVKSITGKTTYRSIPDLITHAGTTLQDDADKANAFNVFFQKQTELKGNDRHPDTTGLPKKPHDFSFSTMPRCVTRMGWSIRLSIKKKVLSYTNRRCSKSNVPSSTGAHNFFFLFFFSLFSRKRKPSLGVR